VIIRIWRTRRWRRVRWRGGRKVREDEEAEERNMTNWEKE
jgi:hypothetical protein